MQGLRFRPGDPVPAAVAGIPVRAVDLRLDELAAALGPGEAGIARLGLLLHPLPSADAVGDRQEVFRDLEEPGVGSALRALGGSVAAIRSTLGRAGRMRHPAERNRWILDALDEHDRAVIALDEALRAGPALRSWTSWRAVSWRAALRSGS